jgi:octanoyl-[GcvH]:protein N-octanoyltransferase
MKEYENKQFPLVLCERRECYTDTNADVPFALDEWLALKAAEGGGPYLHVWQNEKTVVLGNQDMQLPSVEDAIHALKMKGYSCLARQSGGAFVPLDSGVLNLSFVFQVPDATFNIDNDFLWMAHFFVSIFKSWVPSPMIKIAEVPYSYCPGRFDISIEGRKVCGISQRRYARSVVLQAFVNILDDNQERARLAHNFYECASVGAIEKSFVQGDKMGTLQAYAPSLTVTDFYGTLLTECEQRFTAIRKLTVFDGFERWRVQNQKTKHL